MIDANDWKQLDRRIAEVKSKYALENDEIHTAWMARRYSEQENILNFENLDEKERRRRVEKEIKRRAGGVSVSRNSNTKVKAYRREAASIRPYIHLTRTQRINCLNELAREIGSWDNARIFADAIRKPDFQTGKLPTPYEMAFEQVLTRYQTCLRNLRENGIVVHDQNQTVAARLTKLPRRYHSKGTFYRNIENIVETPLFVDSSLTAMIQMADICVFGLRRFIENGETYIWEHVRGRVDRLGGNDVGVRHCTGSRSCSCEICKAHGRKDQ